MEPLKTLEATLGQPVQITLQSMAGSTGYAWYLTQLDGGLALHSAYSVPTASGIAPINQTFEFFANAVGTYQLRFDLLAPWRPGEPGDTALYEITISPAKPTAADDIESAMKGRAFVNAAAVNVGQSDLSPQVLKYAAPMAGPVLKYAAPMPISMKYAAPMPMVLKYAAPTPIVKYAAPMPMVKYAAPTDCGQAMDPCQAMFQAPDPCSDPCNDPCCNMAPPTVIYAAPMAYPYTQDMRPPTQILYAAPMVYPRPLYAAPMVIPRPMYAAPMSNQPIMPYAAPFTSFGCC